MTSITPSGIITELSQIIAVSYTHLEVARFYGYDKIPMTLPTGEATTGKLPFKLRIQEVARDIAEYLLFP